MILFLVLITTELLTLYALRQHFRGISKFSYYIALITSSVMSIYLWIVYLEITLYEGPSDNTVHIWLEMAFRGVLTAILFPRIIFVILHYTGKILTKKREEHMRALTTTGIFIWLTMFSIVTAGSFIGRFNFRTEILEVKVNGLKSDLVGLTIVHLSDIHLSTYHRHPEKLIRVMEEVNSFKPDLIINSGDFVTLSYMEYGRYDTILSRAESKLGNFAVLGNHDIGTYHPGYTASDIAGNMSRMTELITESGYKVLNDENVIITLGETTIGIAGVITKGRHPHMIHGNLDKAVAGMDSVDLALLISHDPNHWKERVTGKTDIDLTLSGHTHGMQIGIWSKWFKWSPSQYFYHEWSGLYNEKDQYLYVNRGLGVLSVPFRIWMPPEITILRLTSGTEKTITD